LNIKPPPPLPLSRPISKEVDLTCVPARCLVDTKPKKFGSARAAVLSNCAELLMWGLERAVMAQIPDSPVLKGEGVRDTKLYGQACALVDTAQPGWRILFANMPFTDLTGPPPHPYSDPRPAPPPPPPHVCWDQMNVLRATIRPGKGHSVGEI